MHHRFEGGDGRAEIVLAVVDQAQVETNARHLWGQVFGLVQHLKRLRPLFAPHGNDAQIGVGPGRVRVQSQNAAKRTLGQVEMVFLQGGLASLKQLLRVSSLSGLLRRARGLRRRAEHEPEQKNGENG